MSFTSCITINGTQHSQHFSPTIDPVCGMKVDTSAALETNYNGRIYYFDSEECQKVFLKIPEKFAAVQSSHHNGSNNMNHIGWMGGTVMAAVMILAMTSMIVFGHWR